MVRTRLAWSVPAADPEVIIRDYLEDARGVPGVRRVWANVHGGRLLIATLVDGNLEHERKLHAVELSLFRAWPEAPIEFTLLWEGDQLPSSLSDEHLVHSHSM